MSAPTARQFAKEQGEKLLRTLTLQVNRTIRSHGVNEVHDLRVAVRRFARALVVLKPSFPRAESRRMRRALKRIMLQAGVVRDHDIAMRVLAKMAVPQSGDMLHEFRERREEAALTLSASLQRWAERGLSTAWRKALNSEKTNKAGNHDDARFCAAPVYTLAKRILPKMASEHFRFGKEAAREDASVEEIHTFRIGAKNLRYTLDLFATLYGASISGLLEQLKDVQALLGDINDCATVRRMLHRQKAARVKSDKDGKDPVGKEVLTALKKRQRKKTEQFRHHYTAEFANTAILRQWKDTLRKVPSTLNGKITGKTAGQAGRSPRPTGKRQPS